MPDPNASRLMIDSNFLAGLSPATFMEPTQSRDAAQIRRDLAVYRWRVSSAPRPAVATLWRGLALDRITPSVRPRRRPCEVGFSPYHASRLKSPFRLHASPGSYPWTQRTPSRLSRPGLIRSHQEKKRCRTATPSVSSFLRSHLNR